MGYHPNLLLQYSTCILSSLQNEAPRTGKKPSNSLERGSKEASRPAWKVPKPHVGTMGANSIGGRPQIRRTRPGGRPARRIFDFLFQHTHSHFRNLVSGREEEEAGRGRGQLVPSFWERWQNALDRPRAKEESNFVVSPDGAFSPRATLRVPNTHGGRECPVADVTACA